MIPMLKLCIMNLCEIISNDSLISEMETHAKTLSILNLAKLMDHRSLASLLWPHLGKHAKMLFKKGRREKELENMKETNNEEATQQIYLHAYPLYLVLPPSLHYEINYLHSIRSCACTVRMQT